MTYRDEGGAKMKYTYVLIVLFLLSTVSSSALEPVRYLTKGYVKDVMFSPDGRYIMVATTNGLDLIDPVSLLSLIHI